MCGLYMYTWETEVEITAYQHVHSPQGIGGERCTQGDSVFPMACIKAGRLHCLGSYTSYQDMIP